MIIRAIEKPFDMILEARNMLFKRIKTLLLFFGLNMVCLSVSFTNKPHLWFCGLVLGCYLLYDLKRKQGYYKSATSLKFSSVSELEKALNMKVDNDEWDTIEKLNQKNVMYFNVENTFFVFFCISYFMVFVRVVLSIIDNHGVLK
ncbi:RipA family octameric membrane protein [Helicobacter pylori]|uniref:RipA family octameric membrane protein n=1 Tax=Helicobacter pylori TaxID=210 RepID=UPI0030C28FB0